jgi:hypothetical protein
MEAKTDAYLVLVGKPEGNRPVRRPRRRWVDNIRKRSDGVVWTGAMWLNIGISAGFS